MSAHAIDRGDLNAAPAGRDKRPGLARLTKVELRKMVDTRSGFWLQLAVLGLTVLAVVITVLAGHSEDKTFRHVFSNALQPAGILLPVVGILLVSSEWSQRTALISFALVPERPRLIVAKVLAGIVLALAATVVALVVAALGTALASTSAPHAWSLPLGLLAQDIIYVATAMVIGIGFGAALQASAPAIVLYFALPVALAALGSIHALKGVIEWVSTAEALEPLTTTVMSGSEWVKALVALALWMGVPLVIGLWRLTRRDVG
ncbi:MAG: ABC transporter permease subunit [Actinobacteria bacterium]|nr:ABC transporter permease subunit [Actinomycetota bacterium]